MTRRFVALCYLAVVMGGAAGYGCAPAAPRPVTVVTPTPSESPAPVSKPTATPEVLVREHRFGEVRCYTTWAGDIACVAAGR